MSHYSEYLSETGLRHIHEDDSGFFTYSVNGEELYIEEIFVKKSARKQGIAGEYVNLSKVIAKEMGCSYIKGSVIPGISGATESLQFQLSIGFKLFYSTSYMVFLKKELGE